MVNNTNRSAAGVWLVLDSRNMGGIESHVAELAAGLLAAGDQPRVMLLADYGPHPLRRRLAAEGVACGVLNGTLGGLVAALRAARPLVIHSHGYKANVLCRLAGLATGTPHVATYHAGERPAGRLALYDWVDRWTAFAGKRVAVSRPIAARLPFGAALIPNFVALPANVPPPTSWRIGFAGRLSHEKGPDIFARLARQLPGAAFCAFGDGPMRAELVADRPNNLTLMGAVDSMAPHWGSIGLLVISSRAEGLPLAALEAMAHGVPVAAFGMGGLPDLISHGKNGFLAQSGDATALVRVVTQFLALSERARADLSSAARRRIAQAYSRAVGVEATRALYLS